MQSQYQRLTDSRWEVVKEPLPIHRKREQSLRVILDAIFWFLRAGGQWRNLPEGSAKWQLVYCYFRKWEQDGTLEQLNFALNRNERSRVGKATSPSQFTIDSRTV